jgi:predicted tellurium resistance membrane protein TerC
MPDFSVLANPDNLISLISLTVLEIVLGIDNVIFLSILVTKLPELQRPKARNVGLFLALLLRLGFLFIISWITRLEADLFVIPIVTVGISGKDLIMLGGGLFLMYKAIVEIHNKIEGAHEGNPAKASSGFTAVILQSVVLSFVFSIDSIITAIGLAKEVLVMAIAIIVSTAVMIGGAGPIDRFIQKHPTLKMLGLALLLLIGVLLIAEAFDVHVPKGYMYFAIVFSLLVETLNIKLRRHVSMVQRTIETADKKNL